MSSDEFRLLGNEELRTECREFLEERFNCVKKLNIELRYVKRPPDIDEFGKIMSLHSGILRNYEFISDVLRFLSEMQIISEKELNSYLKRLFDVDVYCCDYVKV